MIRKIISLKNVLVLRINSIFRLLSNKQFYVHDSYYPERPKHKSKYRIFAEQLYQIIKYRTINSFYFPYGFDCKSLKEQSDYVPYNPFMSRRNKLNLSSPHNSSCILRNKLMFNIYAKGIGIDTTKNVLYSTCRKLYEFNSNNIIDINHFCKLNNTKLFCKLVDGECGNGIFILKIQDGLFYIDDQITQPEDVYNKLTKDCYLVQEMIVQHKEMASLHPESVNSIRLVTVKDLKTGSIQVFPSILRIGTGGSHVDNTSKGGIAVGIEFASGRLKEYGFYKPEYGTKTKFHPDSKIEFSEFVIPHISRAIEQAKYFHSMLYNIHSIGWDIAITENGPIFIEGNDNWEINGPQICNGGLKKQFKELFFK